MSVVFTEYSRIETKICHEYPGDWDTVPIHQKYELVVPHITDEVLQETLDNPADFDSTWVELCQRELAARRWWT